MSGISQIFKPSNTPLILIVDDDKAMRNLLSEYMQEEGYRVLTVTNGQQCLDAYVSQKPDLILLDAIMPIMDGFTCCQKLKEISKKNLALTLVDLDTEVLINNPLMSSLWEQTPILMITGLDDPHSVDHAFDCGASDYVTKPIHWAVLRQRVRRLLQQAQLYKQLEAANQSLQELANMDSLTRVANRRRFDQYLNNQWMNLAQDRNSQEKATMISLILCDIDFFKNYNDKYGHPAGDLCLQKVASVIRHTAQKNQDLVARYGGEEFAVIMPNTDAYGAIHVAAKIQTGIRQKLIPHSESMVSQYLTLSLGVATIIPDFETSPQDLIVAADKALYQAKAQGRNRIILKQVNW